MVERVGQYGCGIYLVKGQNPIRISVENGQIRNGPRLQVLKRGVTPAVFGKGEVCLCTSVLPVAQEFVKGFKCY